MDVNMLMSNLIAFSVGCLEVRIWLVLSFVSYYSRKELLAKMAHVRAALA